ncbi:MAG: SDR family oxidoreductase [Spirochaetota bacterium]
MELKGKIAVITGAGRGIGRETAFALAWEGCSVVLVSRTETELREVERAIKHKGGDALVVVADISKKKDIDIIIDRTLKKYNTLDILINNAGVHIASPFLEVTEKEWDTNMNINLKGMFFLSQAALKVMKERRQGYIINISSTAALEVPARATAYGISKLGVKGLTNALWEEGKEYGVKASVIYPGMTDTKMLREINLPVDSSCWMLPEDIAECILFLLKQSDRIVIKELIPWAARHDKI